MLAVLVQERPAHVERHRAAPGIAHDDPVQAEVPAQGPAFAVVIAVIVVHVPEEKGAALVQPRRHGISLPSVPGVGLDFEDLFFGILVEFMKRIHPAPLVLVEPIIAVVLNAPATGSSALWQTVQAGLRRVGLLVSARAIGSMVLEAEFSMSTPRKCRSSAPGPGCGWWPSSDSGAGTSWYSVCRRAGSQCLASRGR